MMSSSLRSDERVAVVAAESQLIGSILREEADDGQRLREGGPPAEDDEPALAFQPLQRSAAVHGPRIQRSTSAPPQLAALDGSDHTFLAALRTHGATAVAGQTAAAPSRGEGAATGMTAPYAAAAPSLPLHADAPSAVPRASITADSAARGFAVETPSTASAAAADADGSTVVVNGETVSANDPRLSPEYYAYYYLQRPLDPRLPPPLFNWSSWHYAGTTKLEDPAHLRPADVLQAIAEHQQQQQQQHHQQQQRDAHSARQTEPQTQHAMRKADSPEEAARRSPQPYPGGALPALSMSSASFHPPSSHARSAGAASATSQPGAFPSGSPPSSLLSAFPHQPSYLVPSPSSYLSLSPSSSPLTGAMDSLELQKQFHAISLAQDAADAQSPFFHAQPYEGLPPSASLLLSAQPAQPAPHRHAGGAGGASTVSPMLAVMGFGSLNGANSGGSGGGGPPLSYGPPPSSQFHLHGVPYTNGHGPSSHQPRAPERPPLSAAPSPVFFSHTRHHPSSAAERPSALLNMSLGASQGSFPSMQPYDVALMGMGGPTQRDTRLPMRYGGGLPPHRGAGTVWGAGAGYSADVGAGSDRARGSFDPSQSHAQRHSVTPKYARPYGSQLHDLDERLSPMLPFSPGAALSPSLLSLPPKYSPPSSFSLPPSSSSSLSPPIPPSSTSVSGGVAAGGSSWLDDFRLNKSNSHLTLFDLVARGLVLDLSCDQFGSRFIQQRLETATADEKAAAFQQLLGDAVRLSEDVFGNYVVQKLLEHGSDEQRRSLGHALHGYVHALSLHMYGCRVVQKALDTLGHESQADLVQELHGHVMQLVRDSNGNHVVQKVIERCPPFVIHFIVDAFSGQVASLSTHPYGCRVIQRLLEHCSEAQRASLLSEIMAALDDLCRNSYGNYVIQHVLIHGGAEQRSAVVHSIRGKLLPLSKHKFASNVVEKAFAYANKRDRDALLDEVMGRDAPCREQQQQLQQADVSSAVLLAMVKDQFGNYVIQRLIDVLDEEQKLGLVQRIKRFVPSLKKIPYGKHILAKIDKLEMHLHAQQQQQQAAQLHARKQ